MMDCYMQAGDADRPESFRIAAKDDAEAIKEAFYTAIRRRPLYYTVRVVKRTGSEVIHDSRGDGKPTSRPEQRHNQTLKTEMPAPSNATRATRLPDILWLDGKVELQRPEYLDAMRGDIDCATAGDRVRFTELLRENGYTEAAAFLEQRARATLH
jgi:hypothetical protein